MSVGQELQQRRTERQLSVERLAAITKLKPSVIRAMENLDVDALPPMVYLVGHLRVLAAELKLDSDSVVERYVAEYKLECARAEAERLRAEEARLRAEEQRRMEERARVEEAARAEALAQAEAARLAEEIARLQRQLAQPEPPPKPERAPAPRARWVPEVRVPRVALPTWMSATTLGQHRKSLLAAGLAVVVLFAVAMFNPANRAAGDGVAEAAAVVEPQPQPEPDAVRASAVPDGPPMRAEIVLNKTAFVSASADGRSIVSREMAAGERLTVEAQSRAVLRVSDPSAVEVSVDGQPARPLGAGNRSATFEVTRDAIRSF